MVDVVCSHLASISTHFWYPDLGIGHVNSCSKRNLISDWKSDISWNRRKGRPWHQQLFLQSEREEV